ncbi:polysaccharide deacetylase family protein [Natranaerofaba carboxydovora]|uniref:polysaccharide deacetylase family protein n=1 Tax=Natranaerofaba carboxydovora TaxID=2742683 RepID=UPI001F13CCE0|nr:polysaccharide deacetylase family protein [Natranaerofaba carboxydovora]UMZ74334.1 Bifunctional xylanase/deacetylase [Natranaerofaba carboxydovora]
MHPRKKVLFILSLILLIILVTTSYVMANMFNRTEESDYASKLDELYQKYQLLNEENLLLQEKLDSLTEEKYNSTSVYEEKIEEIEELRSGKESIINKLIQTKEELKKIKETNTNKSDDNSNNLNEKNNVAYLTFDDGPTHNTEKILDILKTYDENATFFSIGDDTPFGINMYHRIVDEGHALGNHTYTHDYEKIYNSPEDFMKDFREMEEFLNNTVGIKPNIMRFPGGSKSASALQAAGYDVIEDIIELLNKEGYVYFDWNVTSGDASYPPPDKDEIVNNVLEGATNQEHTVILFHDGPSQDATVKALPKIIEGLKEMGFSFDILSEDSYRAQFSR